MNYLPHPVIGISGQMCDGKDWLADRLAKQWGYKRLNFADQLKQDVADRHGISVADLNANKADYRTELQEYGQRMREEHGEDYWVDRWADAALALDGCPIICSDVRHVNEARFMHEHGHLLVRVRTPTDIRMARIATLYGRVTESQLNHISETSIPRLPYHILLPGTMESDEVVSRFVEAVEAWRYFGKPLQINLDESSEVLYGIATS